MTPSRCFRGLMMTACAGLLALPAACSKSDPGAPKDAATFNPEVQPGELPAERPPMDVRPADLPPDFPGRSFVEVYGIFSDTTGVFGCAGSTCHLPKLGETVTSYGGDLHMDTVVTACTDLVNVAVKDPAGAGKKRVVPGNLNDSWLWCKLNGTSCGTQEPRGLKVPIAATYMDVIKSWIEVNGAHCP